MIKYRFKQNHKYTTPGVSQSYVENMLKSHGVSFASVFEGRPTIQDGHQVVRGTGCAILTDWYFYKSDIDVVNKKPTIIIIGD